MLELQNISVSFNDTKVLNNLSCIIKNGARIVLVGANGSGKTTLFNVIQGSIMPDQGQLILDGVDCTKQTAQQRASWISCLLQDPTRNTVPTLTVAQNLAMALYKGKKVRLRNGVATLQEHPEVSAILKKLGLDHLLERPMGSISGGQRQLIAFIMATIIPPKILLLDEPTAALDPKASTLLLDFAQEYIKEHQITTLLITHDQQIAATFGSETWQMKDGNLITKL
ncbi:MAG: ATP-binding cassette domain-containing protein [Candidatus Babeliales bacterium]